MKKASNEAIKIAKYINTFKEDYAPNHKTNSLNTLSSYKYALSLYVHFLETVKRVRSIEFSAKCFNRETIEEWLTWLKKERECSPDTCNNRLASIRVFLEYLSSREKTWMHLYVEATQIPVRKTTKKREIALSKEALKVLFETPNVSNKTGRRDLVLMLTLYCTATRITELLTLKMKNVHLDNAKPYITVLGKGSKIRSLPLLPKAVAYLEKYIKEFHGNNPNPETPLFYSVYKKLKGEMSRAAIDKRLKLHAEKANKLCEEIPLNLHAHHFRRSRATHWYEEGMNVIQISFLLDHEQITTTMEYICISLEEQIKVLATLEDEDDKKLTKEWDDEVGSLAELCGLTKIR